jgi:type II secretory pathway predicted ATPase ExeA
MYQSFYGLSESAFELTRDSKFVFYTARHREALTHLEDGLSSARPLTVLLGDAGTGKTMVLHASLQSERCRHIRCLYVTSSMVTPGQLLETVAAELEPTALTGSRPATPIQTIQTVLYERRSRGVTTALAIDDAESLSDTDLEQVCALVGMEAAGVPLLPVVLAGHRTLAERLDRPALSVLQARGALRCELAALELSQTASYILWRARAAGVPGGSLFTREAVTLIHIFSEGIPRTISVICDNALLRGFHRDRKPVTREIVKEVCRRLDLAMPATPQPPLPSRQSPARRREVVTLPGW